MRNILSILALAGSLLPSASGQTTPAEPVKIGNVVVSGSLRTRVEAWDWFSGNANNVYTFPGSLARISFSKATKTFDWKRVNAFLREKGVMLISAGLDEVPMVYKNIHEVMAAQKDLVTVLGQFDPKLVKMAPHGERAED